MFALLSFILFKVTLRSYKLSFVISNFFDSPMFNVDVWGVEDTSMVAVLFEILDMPI